MATIAQRKWETKRNIVRLVTGYVDKHPEMRDAIIYGLTYRSMAKMTLKELNFWQDDLEQGEGCEKLTGRDGYTTIKCNHCGKPVSTEVPEGTVVSGDVVCPECLAKRQGAGDG